MAFPSARLVYFLFSAYCQILSIVSALANIPSSELQALKDLFDGTRGAHWYWQPAYAGAIWNFTQTVPNPCLDNWQGITCLIFENKPTVAYISELSLENYNLNGTLPQSIGDFPYLWNLNLPENLLLHGSIPSTIGNLSSLAYLVMNDNSLEGQIPDSVNKLVLLIEIDLESNQLTGTLPNLADLRALTRLDVSRNFIHGTMPQEYCNLITLGSIDVSVNALHKTIPACLGDLKNVTSFYLWNNVFTGTIPASLGNLTKSIYFQLLGNQLTGTVPKSLGDMKGVINFDISNNFLHGSLPTTLTNSTIAYFKVYNNLLSGSVPEGMANLPHMTLFQAYNNMLTGPLPSTFARWTNLVELDISNNFISGSLPTTLNLLANVEKLEFYNNNLMGPLTHRFNASVQIGLRELNLGYNQFTGSLSGALFLLPSLQTFVALSNCLTGSLPAEICQATQMESLTLDGLNTATPCRFNILPRLLSSNVYVASKSLTGSIPACVYTLPHLKTLHVSGNGFTGTLPYNISPSMTELAVSNNLLHGTLPLSYQTNRWLSLDVSYNRLTGELIFPSSTNIQANMSLENNRFSGTIPSTLRNVSSLSLLEGNLFACSFNRQNLPTHDPARKTYDCGSNSFEVSLVIWAVVWLVVTLSVILVVVQGRDNSSSSSSSSGRTFFWENLRGYWQDVYRILYWQDFLSILSDADDDTDADEEEEEEIEKGTHQESDVHGIVDIRKHVSPSPNSSKAATAAAAEVTLNALGKAYCCFQALQQLALFVLSLSIVILLPVYTGLHAAFSNYVVSYAWGISAGFLHGVVSASVVLLVTWSFAVVTLLYGFDWLYSTNKMQLLQQQQQQLQQKQQQQQQQSIITSSNNTSTTSSSSRHKYENGGYDEEEKYDGVVVMESPQPQRQPQRTVSRMESTDSCDVSFAAQQQQHRVNNNNNICSSSSSSSSSRCAATAMMMVEYWQKCCFNHRDNNTHSSSSSSWWTTARLRLQLVICLVILLDIAVVLTVNIVFVRISTVASSRTLAAAQVAVALFKLVWTFVFVRYVSIADIQRAWTGLEETFFFLDTSHHHEHDEPVGSLRKEETKMAAFTARTNLYFQTTVILLNNLAIPVVATAALEANCFNQLLLPPPEVVSTYLTLECYGFIIVLFDYLCLDYAAVPVSTSYHRPFVYSYQCTGALLQNYASAYIYMMLLQTLLVPLAIFVVYQLRRYFVLRSSVTTHETTTTTTTTTTTDNSCIEEAVVNKNTQQDPSKTKIDAKTKTNINTTIAVFLNGLLPHLLRDVSAADDKDHKDDDAEQLQKVEQQTQPTTKKRILLLFNNTVFVISIFSDCAVLLTFGAVFPPVAVVCALAMFSRVCTQQYCIGWYLHQQQQQQQHHLQLQLNQHPNQHLQLSHQLNQHLHPPQDSHTTTTAAVNNLQQYEEEEVVVVARNHVDLHDQHHPTTRHRKSRRLFFALLLLLQTQLRHLGATMSTALRDSLLLPFACLFYLLFVFDIVGSSNFHHALDHHHHNNSNSSRSDWQSALIGCALALSAMLCVHGGLRVFGGGCGDMTTTNTNTNTGRTISVTSAEGGVTMTMTRTMTSVSTNNPIHTDTNGSSS